MNLEAPAAEGTLGPSLGWGAWGNPQKRTCCGREWSDGPERAETPPLLTRRPWEQRTREKQEFGVGLGVALLGFHSSRDVVSAAHPFQSGTSELPEWVPLTKNLGWRRSVTQQRPAWYPRLVRNKTGRYVPAQTGDNPVGVPLLSLRPWTRYSAPHKLSPEIKP